MPGRVLANQKVVDPSGALTVYRQHALCPERQLQIDGVDHRGGGGLRGVVLEVEPARAATCRLADGKPFTIGGLELLNRAVVVHLHEPDPEKGRLATRRFAPELDRAADRATAANVGGAERSGKVVGLNPVCVGWERHGSQRTAPPGSSFGRNCDRGSTALSRR